MFLSSSFFIFLRTSIVSLLVLLFLGCDRVSDGVSSHSLSSSKEPIFSYFLIPQFYDTNISIVSLDDAAELDTSRVNSDGSFEVDIESVEDEKLLMLSIDGTSVRIYILADDLNNRGIKISLLSLFASLEVLEDDNVSVILEKLSSSAQKIFRVSLNDDEVIDYRDLVAFTSNPNGEYLLNPNILEQLQTSTFLEVLLNDENLTAFMNFDKDGDGLTWQEEIYQGSSIELFDSDNDGLSDAKELEVGLSPINSDSDFDTLSDLDELNRGTNPLSSDSDGDYFPDSYELATGRDPLEADENGDSILDGLEGDPLFKYQWYLQSRGELVSTTSDKATIVGNDLDILQVASYEMAKQSIVQVIDTGVEYLHEDLNVSLEYSRNSINGTNDPTPTSALSRYNKTSPFEVGHGTGVAGIIGAIAHNGVGVRGVVPGALIAGSNWLEEQSLEELDRLWYSSANTNDIVVSNNSWGSYVSKDKSFEAILKLASEELRDGKGRIFTFASGNDREIYGNANLSYIANNRYAITVASINHENRYSYYSNPGSNILVSAYGGSSYELGPTIATTLLMGESYYESELGSTLGAITFDEDLNRNYTFTMNGTSASTPMVSGAIALTLASCPDLTWRDVRWLLSYRSKKIDPENELWVKNSAGREHNINYGYGLIDAHSMIEECQNGYYRLLPKELSAEVSLNDINVAIPDTNSSKIISIDFQENFTIEWLELTIASDHPYAGDYEISLTSPHGTKTEIIAPNELRSDYYKDGFRFSSAAFMGESSQGTWSVDVIDRLELDSGAVTSVKLKLYGHTRS